VPAAAVVIVLAAAFLHALWNLILARSADTTATVAMASLVGAALALPIALTRWHLDVAALPYIGVSSAFELGYFVLLARAYRVADLSLVYPVARGLAPVFVLGGSVLVLARPASLESVVGVLLVAIGVVLVRGIRAPARLSDVAMAVALSLLIAGYTLIDKQGVAFADPVAYLVCILAIPGAVCVLGLAASSGVGRVRAAVGPHLLAGGAAAAAAYGLVLVALGMAPAPGVAALRETSIVMATVLAAIVLHERVERARWLGSVVVVAGIALVVAG
jgi:drug/metabolite transporter (DMT)-like permease